MRNNPQDGTVSSFDFMPGANAELALYEKRFLLQLLDKWKPKNIFEIGVSAGGTSAMILRNTAGDQKVTGIDCATQWYRDPRKKVGWNVDAFCQEAEKGRYTLYAGVDPVDIIEDIAYEGIDFCFIDTSHVLPGELLTFFALFPFMKMGCVVALHDLSFNLHVDEGLEPHGAKAGIATRALFCSVSANKKMVPDVRRPNIGAFVIDESAGKHIDSTFFALGLTWHRYPSQDLLQKYAKFISRHYSPFCVAAFDDFVKYQKNLVNIK